MKTKSQALCPAVAKQRRYLKETHKTCCFTLELYSHSRQAETRRQHSAHTRRRKETQAATSLTTNKETRKLRCFWWREACVQYSHQHVETEGRLRLLLGQGRGSKEGQTISTTVNVPARTRRLRNESGVGKWEKRGILDTNRERKAGYQKRRRAKQKQNFQSTRTCEEEGSASAL